MARIKYYYDTETCKYERIKVSTWDVALNLLGFLSVAIIIAVGILIAYNTYFESPKEAYLKKENEELKLYYDILEKQMSDAEKMLVFLQERDDNVYRVIFEADPIPPTIRTAGTGGANKYKELLENGLEQEQLILAAFTKVDRLKKQMYIQTKSYDEILELAQNKADMLAAIPAIQPVSNKELKRLASGFGRRWHPIYKVKKMHWGVDFSAPRGTPIYATGDGVVTSAKKSSRALGYGNMVKIDHGFGYQTHYAHMHSFVVRRGQKVKRGELIGHIGSTGGSTAPHVHYEVIKNGKKINPVRYFFHDISDDEYDKLLELASIENQSLG
ncbi:MAG: M23 family metallopeptidase [Bacteroidetes bacterium]|nr:M23 family metallopeptidase [Bacteroidota bacterium]